MLNCWTDALLDCCTAALLRDCTVAHDCTAARAHAQASGRYMIKLGDGGPSIKVRPECIVHTIDEEGEEGYEQLY